METAHHLCIAHIAPRPFIGISVAFMLQQSAGRHWSNLDRTSFCERVMADCRDHLFCLIILLFYSTSKEYIQIYWVDSWGKLSLCSSLTACSSRRWSETVPSWCWRRFWALSWMIFFIFKIWSRLGSHAWERLYLLLGMFWVCCLTPAYKHVTLWQAMTCDCWF